MKRTSLAIAAIAIAVATACQDNGPERAPDVVGRILQTNMGSDRVNWILLHQLQTPSGVEQIRLDVDSKTRVVWYATGDDVFSHHQNIQRGAMVHAYVTTSLIEGDPPSMRASRIELSIGSR